MPKNKNQSELPSDHNKKAKINNNLDTGIYIAEAVDLSEIKTEKDNEKLVINLTLESQVQATTEELNKNIYDKLKKWEYLIKKYNIDRNPHSIEIIINIGRDLQNTGVNLYTISNDKSENLLSNFLCHCSVEQVQKIVAELQIDFRKLPNLVTQYIKIFQNLTLDLKLIKYFIQRRILIEEEAKKILDDKQGGWKNIVMQLLKPSDMSSNVENKVLSYEQKQLYKAWKDLILSVNMSKCKNKEEVIDQIVEQGIKLKELGVDLNTLKNDKNNHPLSYLLARSTNDAKKISEGLKLDLTKLPNLITFYSRLKNSTINFSLIKYFQSKGVAIDKVAEDIFYKIDNNWKNKLAKKRIVSKEDQASFYEQNDINSLSPKELIKKIKELNTSQILRNDGQFDEFMEYLKVYKNKVGVDALNENESLSLPYFIIKRLKVGKIIKLLEIGFDPNIKDTDGNNALHLALKDKSNLNYKLVNALLENKVDPNIPDGEGKSPIELLKQTQWGKKNPKLFEKVLNLLESKIVDLKQEPVNSDDETDNEDDIDIPVERAVKGDDESNNSSDFEPFTTDQSNTREILGEDSPS